MSFSHAIIAPQGPIRFLEGVGEFFYKQGGEVLYPTSEPESYPNPTYNKAWIQSMWKRYESLGYHLLTGENIPYYSLFDGNNSRLYIYQNNILTRGYTPLSFRATQDLINDKIIFFAEDLTPPP